MYVYEPLDAKTNWTSLYVYTLKDSLTTEMDRKVTNLTDGHVVYAPKFLNLPPGLPNGRSDQLWLLGGIQEVGIADNYIEPGYWNPLIVNDNELKLDPGFIAGANFDNFPQGGFSTTIVNNNNNPILYVIGGFIYSNETKDELITNAFFKYEFNSNKWSDLSHLTKSILRPCAHHRVVVADNSLILVGGLSHNYTLNGNFTITVTSANSKTYLHINTVYKYDLTNEKWSSVPVKTNLDYDIYKNGISLGPSLDIYNGKIISYMSLRNHEVGSWDPKLAYLDFKAKDWEWEMHDVKNSGGTDNTLALVHHQTLIINDQLVLFHGTTNQKKTYQVYAIDLKTNMLQGFINFTGNYGKTSSGLPTWAKILISVICVVLVILIGLATWFYLRYKKHAKPEEKNKQKMQDVWAASAHETEGKNKGDTALTFGNTVTSNGQTSTAISEEAMMGYDYFQHEVDLDDMEETKMSSKV